MDELFEANEVSIEAETDGSGPYGVRHPDEESFQKLDPKLVQIEAVQGLITLGIFGAAAVIGLTVCYFFRGFDWLFFTLLGSLFGLAFLIGFAAFVWPKLFFRHARWRLDQLSLEIHQGVFWQHRVSVPLGRVQHADVSQGPLQRYFGLGKLIVHTAGTYQASVELDGLSHETALQIRDQLIAQTQPLVRNQLRRDAGSEQT